MEGAEPVGSLLVSSLSALTEKIQSTVEGAREAYSQAELFEFLAYSHDANWGVMKLFAVTPAYAECLKKLGLQSKAELEQLWEKHDGEPGVKDAVQKLLLAENSFTEFVDEVEGKLIPFENRLTTKEPVQVGQHLPKDHPLIDVSSGKSLTLEACWKEAKYTLFVLLRLFG